METLIEILSGRSPKLLAMPASGVGVLVPAHPITARVLFAQYPDVIAAVDGPMFSFCEGEPNRNYGAYQCGAVDYLLKDDSTGVNVPGKGGYEGRGCTFSLAGGRLTVQSGRSVQAGASVAFQMYPALVRGGRVVIGQRPSGPDAEANHRIAVCVLQDGRLGFAYSRASMYEFAQQLVEEGVTDAGYTDGGGSASLVMRLPEGGLQGTDGDDPDGRRVPSWIVWRRPTEQGTGRTTTDLVLVDKPAEMVKKVGIAGAVVTSLVVGGLLVWLVNRNV